MTEPPATGGGFLRRATERARQAADTLKREYRKGVVGDDSPVERIGPNAIDAIKGWLARADDDQAVDDPTRSPTTGTTGVDPRSDAAGSDDATEVANLLGKVDWRKVSGAVKDHAAAQRMTDLAHQVDWSAAKPVASRLASALIAAAAAGELGALQGTAGRYVARTIANETGLADKVAQKISGNRTERSQALVHYIETTATEVPGGDFEANLADLGRLGTVD